MLFSTETGDHVKCFCCDGALRNWEPEDDPWVEHARWFYRCNFLVSVKGDEYVKSIQEQYKVFFVFFLTIFRAIYTKSVFYYSQLLFHRWNRVLNQ